MIKGICPNPDCLCNLSDPNNVIVTKESKVFPGHNVYVLCKSCNLIMIYNTTRGFLYRLDQYQNDQTVIDEINELLKEVDDNYEVVNQTEEQTTGEIELIKQEVVEEEAEEEPVELISEKDEELIQLLRELQLGCSGDCSNCTNCDCHSYVEPEPEMEPEIEEKELLLLIHKETGHKEVICIDNLDSVDDIDAYNAYILSPIEIKPIVTVEYKIIRK